MKNVISIILCCILLICFIIFVSAGSKSITIYGPVTEDTSQVKILCDALMNSEDWLFWHNASYIILRSGQYEYYCFYNIEPNSYAYYIKYYGTQQNQGQIIWHLESGLGDAPVINNPNNYTFVSSSQVYPDSDPTLASPRLDQAAYRRCMYPLMMLLTLTFLYYVFRVKRRNI